MATGEPPIDSVAAMQTALIHKHDPPTSNEPPAELAALEITPIELSEPAAKRARIEGPTCAVGAFNNVTRYPRLLINSRSTANRRSRCEPDVFQVIVGAERFTCTATRQVLSQSPVLGARVSDRWQAGRSHEIELLDEQPIDIFLLIGFLKSGLTKLPDLEQLMPSHDHIIDKTAIIAQQLADLFIVGDRYLLPQLQACVMQELQANKVIMRTPRYFIHVAMTIFKSQADNHNIYADFFQKNFPMLTSHITRGEMEWITANLNQNGEHLALNILASEESRAQLLVTNYTSTVSKTTAKKDAYQLYCEHLKRQNQELAEKWALESAARAHAEVMAHKVAALEKELAETKQQLAEAQGGPQFNLTMELRKRLDKAQMNHDCDHAAFYDCGFERRPEPSGKRKWAG